MPKPPPAPDYPDPTKPWVLSDYDRIVMKSCASSQRVRMRMTAPESTPSGESGEPLELGMCHDCEERKGIHPVVVNGKTVLFVCVLCWNRNWSKWMHKPGCPCERCDQLRRGLQ